jgi:hypothetical protein
VQFYYIDKHYIKSVELCLSVTIALSQYKIVLADSNNGSGSYTLDGEYFYQAAYALWQRVGDCFCQLFVSP